MTLNRFARNCATGALRGLTWEMYNFFRYHRF